MKYILTLIAVAVSFTFGACANGSCEKKPADKCAKKGDTCCAAKTPAKKK